MIRKPMFVVLLTIMMAASAGLPALAQLTIPVSTCLVPESPPEPLMLTMPSAPVEPPCASEGCPKTVVDKYNREMLAFNEAVEKANNEYRVYQRKLMDISRTYTDYVNCEVKRINTFIADITS